MNPIHFMKRLILLALCLSLTAPVVFAAKGEKKAGKGNRKAVAALTKGADKNSNQKIDEDEVASLRDAFAKGGDDVKGLDRNANGKLDDDEITALNARLESRGKAKAERKEKAKGKKKQKA
jgi:hypothetical protein